MEGAFLDKTEAICEILKSKGIKLTKQRKSIIESLADIEGHINAQELFQKVLKKAPGTNFSTIYRNLEMLVDMDVVRKFNLNDNTYYYELKSIEHHHHLICVKCGKSMELEFCPFKNIDKEILNNMDFQPSDHIFEIYGYCKDCKLNKK